MIDWPFSPLVIAACLLTYLLPSTLAVVATASTLRCLRIRNADVRLTIWKLALLVPIVTSLAAALFDLPHVGARLVLVLGSAMTPRLPAR